MEKNLVEAVALSLDTAKELDEALGHFDDILLAWKRLQEANTNENKALLALSIEFTEKHLSNVKRTKGSILELCSEFLLSQHEHDDENKKAHAE